jgi:hypothetical protein
VLTALSFSSRLNVTVTMPSPSARRACCDMLGNATPFVPARHER